MMIFLRLFFGCLEQLVPYGFLCLYPFRRHFRFPKRKTLLITAVLGVTASAVFALAGSVLASALPADPSLLLLVNVTFLFVLILGFCWYLYCVKDIWQKKLLIFSLTVTAALLITSVYNCLDARNVSDHSWLPYGGDFYLYYPIAELISLLPSWILLKYFYLPIEDGLNAKESGYLSLLSMLLCALLVPGLSLTLPELLRSTPSLRYLFCMLMISVFMVYVLIFKSYGLTHEKMLSQQEAMRLQHQSELSAEQYRRIHDQIEHNRRMRHDLVHHLLTMRSFLETGETGQAEEYLDQYLESTRKYEISRFCGNPVVNMLISHYGALAKEQDLDFSVRVNIPDALPIQDIDLSVLLGNLLDNAVRAAAHAPEESRFVRLNMICSGKMLAITVDNGFDGNVKLDGGRYLSTKPGHLGMGLKSLDDISKKYHGGVEFTHDGTEFHASVMAGLEESRERS